jgi:hypothetical protein
MLFNSQIVSQRMFHIIDVHFQENIISVKICGRTALHTSPSEV